MSSISMLLEDTFPLFPRVACVEDLPPPQSSCKEGTRQHRAV